jgi:hypothetical protein
MRQTTVLRAGLPKLLSHELGEGRVLKHPGGDKNAMGDDRDNRWDGPWRIAARRGFHLVFDAGVGRLILLVPGGEGGAEKDGNGGWPDAVRTVECVHATLSEGPLFIEWGSLHQ